jgi:hypothetical protein
VSQQSEIVSTQTLTEMIEHQLIAIPMQQAIEAPTCKPLPVVSAVGQWITTDDCMAATVLTQQALHGLTLTARILDCSGNMHYMSYDLSGVTVGMRTTLELPTTPGYMLDVCVSYSGTGLVLGKCFVSVSLQHTCQSGVPPNNMLAQGYVSDLYAISWPSQPNTGPATSGIPVVGTGAITLVQSAAGFGTAVNSISVSLPLTVTAGNMLVVTFAADHSIGGSDTTTDSAGDTFAETADNFNLIIRHVLSAIGGATTVKCKYSGTGTGDMIVHVLEIAGVDSTTAPLVSPIAHNGSPQSVTSATTGHQMFGVAASLIQMTAATDFIGVTGWTLIQDSTSSVNWRAATWIVAQPIAVNTALSFTATAANTLHMWLNTGGFKLVGG